jgi:hypothetical protein
MNTKAEILNELKEIAPVLAAVKETETPLAVPEHYFLQFADLVLEKTAAQSSFLDSLPKAPLEIPEGYFTQFQDAVLSKIQADKQLPSNKNVLSVFSSRVFSINHLFSRAAIAAVLAGVAAVAILIFTKPAIPADDCTDGIACLTQEEIYQYMYQNSHEFATQQVEIVASTAISDSVAAVIDAEISADDINEYLEHNLHASEWDDASTDIF